MTRYWIGVACREHVGRGVAGGFAQLCHGKAAPLARMQAGDGLIYYSPVEVFGSNTPCQAFTAIGTVCGAAPYQVSMGADFQPWRRDIDFVAAKLAPIRPLIPQLAFISDTARWGYPLRFGHLQISAADFYLIAAAMQAAPPPPITAQTEQLNFRRRHHDTYSHASFWRYRVRQLPAQARCQ